MLREAIVLAHTVPGAVLRLVTHRGEVTVGGPDHDLSPCDLRQAYLVGCPGRRDCFPVVREVELGGVVRELGGGLYEAWAPDLASVQRWFVTSLFPATSSSWPTGGTDGDLPWSRCGPMSPPTPPRPVVGAPGCRRRRPGGHLDGGERRFLERCMAEAHPVSRLRQIPRFS